MHVIKRLLCTVNEDVNVIAVVSSDIHFWIF